MPEQGLKELYIDELKDLYSAETQLVKALPKMAKAASSDELRQGFEEHLEQTRGHVQRLEQVFTMLGENLQEEKETDEKLTELSKQINAEAREGGEEVEAETRGKRKTKRAA